MTKLEMLGWRPKIDLENGLRDTILWYKDNYQWWKYFQGQYEI
jgi:dTDP-glucose 4,6-dehydratase